MDGAMKLGQAEHLGLVGGSFTALARLRRGLPSEDVSSSADLPGVSSENNLVYSTPDASKEDVENNKALFLGVRDGHLAMSFGLETCASMMQVPMDKTLTVAWSYDAKAKEQRLFFGDGTVERCSIDGPFEGFGQDVWIGEGHGHSVAWAGELSSLYLFPSVLSDAQIIDTFQYTPTWSLPQMLSLAGDKGREDGLPHAGAPGVVVGAARDLGFDMNSFTVSLRMKRAEAQEDTANALYTVLGTPQDDSMELAVRKGSLTFRFGGSPACVSEVPVPKGKWVRAAFAYNANGHEQLIYQDGQLVKACQGTPPYEAGDKMLWLGRPAGAAMGETGSWHGALKDVQVWNLSVCSEELERAFNAQQNDDGGSGWQGPDFIAPQDTNITAGSAAESVVEASG
jgi:hypothetical protein